MLLDLATGKEITAKPPAGDPVDRTATAFAFRDRSVPGLRVVPDGQDVEGSVAGGRRWRVAGPLWALVDGVVVAGGVTAVDARTGLELWSATGDGVFSDGDRVGVVGDGALTARHVRDGTVLWRLVVDGSLAGVTDDGVVLAGQEVSFLAP